MVVGIVGMVWELQTSNCEQIHLVPWFFSHQKEWIPVQVLHLSHELWPSLLVFLPGSTPGCLDVLQLTSTPSAPVSCLTEHEAT